MNQKLACICNMCEFADMTKNCTETISILRRMDQDFGIETPSMMTSEYFYRDVFIINILL